MRIEKIKKYVRLFLSYLLHSIAIPERVFLLVALLFGVPMIFLMPPTMAPDEKLHLYRAYSITEGEILNATKLDNESIYGKTGASLDRDLITAAEKAEKVRLIARDSNSKDLRPHVPADYFIDTIIRQNEQKDFIAFSSSAVYSPVAYLPQVLGIIIAKQFNPTFFTIIEYGRLFNLLAFVTITYFAIRILPFKKWFIVAVGLLPMTIQQVASLSPDAVTISLCFLAIGFIIKLFSQKNIITRTQLALLFILSGLVALTKQSSIVLLFPVLFLPRSLFINNKQRFLLIGVSLLIAVICAGGWYILIKSLGYDTDITQSVAVNQSNQLHYIIDNPMSYVKTLYHTFIYSNLHGLATSSFYITSLIGSFAWIDYELPVVFVVASYMLLLVALMENKSRIIFSISKKIIFITTVLLSIIATSTILYLAWTPVGSPVIEGIQGRYFIAFLPLLIPLFMSKRQYFFISQVRMGILVLGICFLSLIAMEIQTYQWFWV